MLSRVAVKKAAFLGSLYLAQTVPKGYLKFLPVLMAERGESMLTISSVALFSMGDWLKPIFGAMLDLQQVQSLRSRKAIIVVIQVAVIAVFAASLSMEQPELVQLAALFSLCSLLTSIHDTAVDGLAVQLLNTDEQAIGGFGQYAGYKAGSLLTGGILPSIVGTNHRWLCVGVMIPMLVVLLMTVQLDLSQMQSKPTSRRLKRGLRITNMSADSQAKAAPQESSLLQIAQRYLTSAHGLQTLLLLFMYKFADHGLDFIGRQC
jgi:hypothetical protein